VIPAADLAPGQTFEVVLRPGRTMILTVAGPDSPLVTETFPAVEVLPDGSVYVRGEEGCALLGPGATVKVLDDRPLSAPGAHVLNSLARASERLEGDLVALVDRATKALEEVRAGGRISGGTISSSSYLARYAADADTAAATRTALIDAAVALGLAEETILEAARPTSRYFVLAGPRSS
jgi:hypothetical protein